MEKEIRINPETYNLVFEHKLMMFFDHTLYLWHDKFNAYQNLYNTVNKTKKPKFNPLLDLNKLKKAIENLEKKANYGKKILSSVQPLVSFLRPIYVSTSSRSLSTYFIFEKTKINEVLDNLDMLDIRYTNYYRNGFDEQNPDIIKVRFADHDYDAEDIDGPISYNRKFINNKYFIDVRFSELRK